MDKYLIDYLQSGKAWVLVGSGPSIDMGYPSWEQFATSAIELIKSEAGVIGLSSINKAFDRGDYPLVLQGVKDIIGGPRLLQFLRETNKRHRIGRIYPLIAQWPVPVYLTTNFDDEIQRNLASLGESYNVYSNSEEHMGLLVPESSGVIVKLHGDLTQEHNTILATESYNEISSGENWNYWR
ncbi:SIR2 family protein [Chloroflexota bacterium]